MAKHLKISFIPFLFLLVSVKVYSQDVHYTQYDASSIILNPANTGNFDAFWRVTSQYRNQWRALGKPFTTFGLSYDQRLLKDNPIGLGAIVLRDQSGDGRILNTKFYVSAAIELKLSAKHKLHFGLQPGLVFKTLNDDGLTFPNQFDAATGYFNGDIPNEEAFQGLGKNYFDINTGVSWNYSNGKFFPNAGIALYHLNRANQSLLGYSNNVPIRKVLHASLGFKTGSNFAVIPKLLVMQANKASEFTVGSYFTYYTNGLNQSAIFAGIMNRTGINRNTDAFSLIVGFSQTCFDLGFSYDINTSTLQQLTGKRGAFELSLVYYSKSGKFNRKNIICERY